MSGTERMALPPKDEERKPTAELAKMARALASELFKGPCLNMKPIGPVPGGERCLEKQSRRGPHGRSAEPRSFLDYDTARMCAPCAAYWHAERAAQLMEHIDADERRARARAEDPADQALRLAKEQKIVPKGKV